MAKNTLGTFRTNVPFHRFDDLLVGAVKDANAAAIKLGVKIGMSGREALDRM